MSKDPREINGPVWTDPTPYEVFAKEYENPKHIHPDNPDPKFKKYHWTELKWDEREEGPPWDKDWFSPVDILFDGFINNYYRQMYIDQHTISDCEWAKKYPEHAEEYVFEEDINKMKNHMIYLLEQDIVYTDIGGIEPDSKENEHIDLPGSDLRTNQPPQTVKSQVITLRHDLIPHGDNNPKNNIYDSDPWMFAFDNDRQEWRHFNIRRIHHMWNMHLRYWYPDQLWIMDKLTRFTAKVTYKIDPKIDSRPDEFDDPNLVRNVLVTLMPDKIPHEPEWDKVHWEPYNLRYKRDNKVVLWNIDKQEWLTLTLDQLYDMKIDEDKTPPPPEESEDFDPTTIDGHPKGPKKPEFQNKD